MTTTVIVNIEIDHHHYQVHTHELTGAQLKALAGIPPANLLFREGPGNQDDQPIQDNAPVELHDGDRFYDMPPGTFGC
jgi:hypothetical protein